MIKKIVYLGVASILLSSIISCEKDFTEVGAAIIDNDKFSTKTLVLDVDITEKNIDYVKAGNTENTIGEYLFGVYKKQNAQTLEAGIVSQLTVPSNLKITTTLKDGETLQPPNLDAVILKIPVQATLKNNIFKIDSLLGNSDKNFTLNVYRNLTYLNTLDPQNTSKKNVYLSNKQYDKDATKLNAKATINFDNLANDTLFVFNRTLSNGNTFKDTLKVLNAKKANPFIAIELDKSKLKELIFDKYKNTELASQEAFNNYFRGIIIEVLGSDGAMIPLNLTSTTLKPSVDFIHTSTVTKGTAIKDTLKTVNSFYLGGVSNSIYKMSGNTASLANNFVLQGTAGSIASVKISDTDLTELRKKQILINDASLIFDVNTAVTDSIKTPKKLFLYKNEKDKSSGAIVPTQLKDALTNSLKGGLVLKDNKPDNYTFGLINHISDLIKGEVSNSELILKVYNTSDAPTSASDIYVKNYNWNPRSVNLLKNATENGTKRGAKLVISYTEKK